MADLTQTATSVVKGADATVLTAYAGETIAAGNLVYLHSDNLLYNAKDDTAAHADADGIALNGGAVNQAITYQTGGKVNPGATVVVDMIYIVSVNAGKIAPFADLTSAHYLTIFGRGTTTSLILIALDASGLAKP